MLCTADFLPNNAVLMSIQFPLAALLLLSAPLSFSAMYFVPKRRPCALADRDGNFEGNCFAPIITLSCLYPFPFTHSKALLLMEELLQTSSHRDSVSLRITRSVRSVPRTSDLAAWESD